MTTNETYNKLLPEFIRFKSVSTDSTHKDDMQATANWLKKTFEERDFTVTLLEGYGNPVVVARFDADQKETALIYGHYDVQPALESEGWFGDPFEVIEKDGRLNARGVVDNKGQVLIHMATIFDLIKEDKLAYNVVFMIEGDEETADGDLHTCLKDHKKLFKADFALTSDGSITQKMPTLELGFRGGFNTTVTIKTSHTDLHSGTYGGATPNAGLVLNKLLAKLHDDDDNRVTIPEFYDDVDPIDDSILDNHKNYPFDHEEHCRHSGTSALDCEPDYDFYTQTGLRPSAEITGIEVGYIGEGYRNAIPSWARAKVNFRLVESQKPDKIIADFEDWVRAQIPDYADVEIDSTEGWRGLKLDVNNGYICKAAAILKDIYGEEPLYIYCGGSIPVIVDFREILGLPQVLVPLVNEDCNMHAVNENYELKQLERSLEFSEKFFSK